MHVHLFRHDFVHFFYTRFVKRILFFYGFRMLIQRFKQCRVRATTELSQLSIEGRFFSPFPDLSFRALSKNNLALARVRYYGEVCLIQIIHREIIYGWQVEDRQQRPNFWTCISRKESWHTFTDRQQIY